MGLKEWTILPGSEVIRPDGERDLFMREHKVCLSSEVDALLERLRDVIKGFRDGADFAEVNYKPNDTDTPARIEAFRQAADQVERAIEGKE